MKRMKFSVLTFASHSLPDSAEHEGCTMGTFQWNTERAYNKFMSLWLGLLDGCYWCDCGHWFRRSGCVNLNSEKK